MSFGFAALEVVELWGAVLDGGLLQVLRAEMGEERPGRERVRHGREPCDWRVLPHVRRGRMDPALMTAAKPCDRADDDEAVDHPICFHQIITIWGAFWDHGRAIGAGLPDPRVVRRGHPRHCARLHPQSQAHEVREASWGDHVVVVAVGRVEVVAGAQLRTSFADAA
eukprot:9477436-Pyramimonas_sp.AAC.1